MPAPLPSPPPAGALRPAPAAEVAAARGQRFDRLDALRGVAIVWMAAFHFAFDLNHFRFIRENFYTDPFWTTQRTLIVSMFLFCAGLGQAAAAAQGQTWPRFWKRWAQVAGCALLVSAGSALMFPKSWISFGVLHGLALMLILVRLAAPLAAHRSGAAVLLALAALALLLPHVAAHPVFDTRLTNWVGLVTRKPVTEDFVPVLPWIGVMLLGLVVGTWILQRHHAWLAGSVNASVRPLAVLGRWSLSFYMLHQPVFIGILMAVVWLRGVWG
jgi:uncharacterized membrane protein